MKAALAPALALALALVLSACPGPSPPRDAPVDHCEAPGQRCFYAAGKIGICRATKSGGIRCASQH